MKNTPNSFHNTTLLQTLRARGVERPILTGMTTHGCLTSTIRAARDYGFECIVPSDTTATYDLGLFDEILPAEMVRKIMIASHQFYYARITTAQDFLNGLKKEQING